MDSQLFARALGSISSETVRRAELSRRLHFIEPMPEIEFDGHGSLSPTTESYRQYEYRRSTKDQICAHRAGVNCIAVDRFEGR